MNDGEKERYTSSRPTRTPARAGSAARPRAPPPPPRRPTARRPPSMDPTSYLAAIHAHPNDTRISFEAASHTYTLDGSPDPLPASVTAIYGAHFDAFDSASTLRRYMGRWAEDETNKYFQLIQYLTLVENKTPAECEVAIARLWAANGAAQAQLGTDMHAWIEQSLNVDPSQPLSARGGPPPPSSSPELRQYEAFRRDVPLACGWTPYRTEWSIFDAASLVAGQVDALYVDRDGGLHMVDWKRSKKDLSAQAKHWDRFGRAGGVLAHVTDTPFHRYSLQQSLYRHILETGYYGDDGKGGRARMPGPILSMHLAQFHPALDTYRLIPVRDMRDEARDLMAGFRGSAAFQDAKRRRVVDGIEGAVVGMAGGGYHSLVTTREGRVLVFGSGSAGQLGLGAGVEEALTPTAIDGITTSDGEEGKEGKE